MCGKELELVHLIDSKSQACLGELLRVDQRKLCLAICSFCLGYLFFPVFCFQRDIQVSFLHLDSLDSFFMDAVQSIHNHHLFRVRVFCANFS